MSSETVMIRPAQPVDWPRIQTIFQAAAQAAWAHIFEPDKLETLSLNESWREFMESPGHSSAFLVGSQQERTYGFVAFRPYEDSRVTAELALLYVHPDAWGNGLAATLLRDAESRIAALGFQEAVLFTEERNQRPRSFYERVGWELDGSFRERTFRETPLKELRYMKRLG